MENDIAGDPMNEKKWSKKTTYSLKDDLKEEGIEISPNTVGKVLKYGKFSLRVNRKTIAETKHPDRNEQAGASKWNPTDHRLFSFISLNWQGVPLRSYDIALGIRSATTRKGLKVEAMLNQNEYKKGIKITDKQMKEINLVKGKRLTQWNYKIAA